MYNVGDDEQLQTSNEFVAIKLNFKRDEIGMVLRPNTE